MRIEVFERVMDIDEEERRMLDDLGIEPKGGKKFKWRRVYFYPSEIFAVKEVNDTQSIIEFNDGVNMVVKGSYETIKKLLDDSEEGDESDLVLD